MCQYGLLRASVRKSSVACCFIVEIHKISSMEQSHGMMKSQGCWNPLGDSPRMRSHPKPNSKETCYFPKLIDCGTFSFVTSCCLLSFVGCQASESLPKLRNSRLCESSWEAQPSSHHRRWRQIVPWPHFHGTRVPHQGQGQSGPVAAPGTLTLK